ncbi:MAG: Serine/threonine-protein kinase PknB, partial [Planctomycetota bacterium]
MSAEDSTIQQAELDRLIADFLERQDRGERVNEESMLREHPEHADGLRAFFGENARLHRVRSGFRDAESQSMEYRAGDQIGGRYKLLELIGEGGMGSVWLAQQLQPIKRKVAIKLIR